MFAQLGTRWSEVNEGMSDSDRAERTSAQQGAEQPETHPGEGSRPEEEPSGFPTDFTALSDEGAWKQAFRNELLRQLTDAQEKGLFTREVLVSDSDWLIAAVSEWEKPLRFEAIRMIREAKDKCTSVEDLKATVMEVYRTYSENLVTLSIQLLAERTNARNQPDPVQKQDGPEHRTGRGRDKPGLSSRSGKKKRKKRF